jgi:hypothetical protein
MTELQGIGTMGFVEYLDVLLDAPTDAVRSEIMDQRAAARVHVPRARPNMPPYDRKRRSLTQLMPRHLDWVEKLAIRPDHVEGKAFRPTYDRESMQEYFCEHYTRFSPPLRGSLVKDVPSDEFRRWWMIGNLLDLVDDR